DATGGASRRDCDLDQSRRGTAHRHQRRQSVQVLGGAGHRRSLQRGVHQAGNVRVLLLDPSADDGHHRRQMRRGSLRCPVDHIQQSVQCSCCSGGGNDSRSPPPSDSSCSTLWVWPITRYTAGTTNSVNSVPIDKPVKITKPMSWRPAAPAPPANTSGTTPSTMAMVVIRIGRKRTAAASSIASRLLYPCSRCNWLANSTIRMPCLLIRPTSVTRPTWV